MELHQRISDVAQAHVPCQLPALVVQLGLVLVACGTDGRCRLHRTNRWPRAWRTALGQRTPSLKLLLQAAIPGTSRHRSGKLRLLPGSGLVTLAQQSVWQVIHAEKDQEAV